MATPQPSQQATVDELYYSGVATATSVASCLGHSGRMRERERLTMDAPGVILTLVGLPARGKSFISRKVERFLRWRGLETKSFNVGKYRREAANPEQSGRSEFFDPKNGAAKKAREEAAAAALSDVLRFLDNGGKVAIFDATNSTSVRRSYIQERVSNHSAKYCVIFLEVICDDPEVIQINMQYKIQNSPDFHGLGLEDALADLKARVLKYEAVYETVQDEEGAYIKLYNLSSKVMAHQCFGRVTKSMMPYLMGIHVGARPIWIVRAGSGQANPQSPGGDDRLSSLSDSGKSFAQGLGDFIQERVQRYWKESGKTVHGATLHVLTSTMPRAVACVSGVAPEHEQTSALNPLDKGLIGDGFWGVECQDDFPPWEEVKRRNPEFWSAWQQDAWRHRFPGGESYMDVARRLESVLIEIEACTKPVLVVSHLTTLSLLLSYFRGTPVEDAWQLPVPKETVIEVLPSLGGGFVCHEHPLRLDSTGTSSRPSRSPTSESITKEMGEDCILEPFAKKIRVQ